MAGILIAILFLLVLAALPRWPYSTRWGWGPSGVLAIAMLLAIIAFIFLWA